MKKVSPLADSDLLWLSEFADANPIGLTELLSPYDDLSISLTTGRTIPFAPTHAGRHIGADGSWSARWSEPLTAEARFLGEVTWSDSFIGLRWWVRGPLPRGLVWFNLAQMGPQRRANADLWVELGHPKSSPRRWQITARTLGYSPTAVLWNCLARLTPEDDAERP